VSAAAQEHLKKAGHLTLLESLKRRTIIQLEHDNEIRRAQREELLAAFAMRSRATSLKGWTKSCRDPPGEPSTRFRERLPRAIGQA
jgi:hypothetical protein